MTPIGPAAQGCALASAISSYVATGVYPDADDKRICGYAEQLWTDAGGAADEIDWRAMLIPLLAERSIIDAMYEQVRSQGEKGARR